MDKIIGTTICAIKKDGCVAIAGDGQVTFGNSSIMKKNAKKVRKIYNDKVIIGFAGSVSDAFALFQRFEGMLCKYSGNLKRSAVEIAKCWRQDKYIRSLEAIMIAADKDSILIITGSGEVIEPDDNICAIGSGGNYALAAAKALYNETSYNACEIAEKALLIASDICIYTNNNIVIEKL